MNASWRRRSSSVDNEVQRSETRRARGSLKRMIERQKNGKNRKKVIDDSGIHGKRGWDRQWNSGERAATRQPSIGGGKSVESIVKEGRWERAERGKAGKTSSSNSKQQAGRQARGRPDRSRISEKRRFVVFATALLSQRRQERSPSPALTR